MKNKTKTWRRLYIQRKCVWVCQLSDSFLLSTLSLIGSFFFCLLITYSCFQSFIFLKIFLSLSVIILSNSFTFLSWISFIHSIVFLSFWFIIYILLIFHLLSFIFFFYKFIFPLVYLSYSFLFFFFHQFYSFFHSLLLFLLLSFSYFILFYLSVFFDFYWFFKINFLHCEINIIIILINIKTILKKEKYLLFSSCLNFSFLFFSHFTVFISLYFH